jgi:hypothetical protein
VLFDGPQNELQSLADVLREVQNGPPSLTICRKLAPSSNSFGFGLSFCRES